MTPEEADNMQEWAGMDGAIAWHLIDRHADNWNEAGEMMNAWLRANGGGQWIPCSEKMPEDGQTVAFVAKTSGTFEYIDGRVFGGNYSAAQYGGGFSVPGLVVDAKCWRMLPAAPSNTELTGAEPALSAERPR